MTPRTVRLELDYNLAPSKAETMIEAVRANALNVQFGIFNGSTPHNLSGIVSITFNIRPSRSEASNLASLTLAAVDLTQLPNRARWDNGVMQHGTFRWSVGQMNQTVSAPYTDYWWSAYALTDTSDNEITLGDGVFRLYESNIDNADTPPVGAGATITAAEADTRYLAHTTNGILAPTNPLNKRGSKTLSAGDSNGTVVFGGTAFAAAPSQILLQMEMHDGSGAVIFANPHTLTTTGFSFELSGEVPATGTYKLHWMAIA